MRHIPNILSVTRILMTGFFVYAFRDGKILVALYIYIAAFLTDLVDGFLARRMGWTTDLGKVLDPLADKLMLIAVMVCMYLRRWIPGFLLAIVLSKELIMIIAGAALYKKKVVVYSDWVGKTATGFFAAGIVATMLKQYWSWIGNWNFILLCIAVAATLIALVHYARKTVFNRNNQDA